MSVIDGDVDRISSRLLKQRPGNDIGVGGSITLVQSLLEAGLVDELRLVIAPALHMQDFPFLRKGTAARLALTRHVVSPAGYLTLDYRVGD